MPLVTNEMNIAMALRQAHLMPGIVPQSFYPEAMLDIKYGDQQVLLGNELTARDTAQEPNVTVIPQDDRYTLLMIDPDTKSCHWAVSPGSSDNDSTAAALQAYQRPDPPHRYAFLLYKQSQPMDRQSFDAQQIMEHEPLVGVNFFKAKE